MCAVVGQRDGDKVAILAELVLPDSNTEAACEAFLARSAQWLSNSNGPIPLEVYGDSTGRGRKTSASRTD